VFFQFRSSGYHGLNSIDKSLLKRASSGLNEVQLLSIALDSPVHAFKSKRQMQDTPLLITKLNKSQLRQNRLVRRKASVGDESECSSASITPPARKSFEAAALDTIGFEAAEEPEAARRALDAQRRRNLVFSEPEEALPCAPPNCIESLGLVIKLIREKLSFRRPQEGVSGTDVC